MYPNVLLWAVFFKSNLYVNNICVGLSESYYISCKGQPAKALCELLNLHLGPVLSVKPIQAVCHLKDNAVWACHPRAGALQCNSDDVYLFLKLFLLKPKEPGAAGARTDRCIGNFLSKAG